MVNRMALDLVTRAEYGRDPFGVTLIVGDAFERAVDRFAGCDGSKQQQDMVTGNHRLQIVAENNLSICAEFRRHDIDIFLAVHSVGAAFCERLGQECADDLGPIHTDDRIDGLFIREASSQRFRGFTRHGEIMLHRSDIDIIVDV